MGNLVIGQIENRVSLFFIYSFTKLLNYQMKPGKPSSCLRSRSCEKGNSSANELIQLTASQGRDGKPKARGPGHGQRYGQDLSARPQRSALPFGLTHDARL